MTRSKVTSEDQYTTRVFIYLKFLYTHAFLAVPHNLLPISTYLKRIIILLFVFMRANLLE